MLMAELTAMRRWLTLANIAISGGQESETTCSLQLSLGQLTSTISLFNQLVFLPIYIQHSHPRRPVWDHLLLIVVRWENFESWTWTISFSTSWCFSNDYLANQPSGFCLGHNPLTFIFIKLIHAPIVTDKQTVYHFFFKSAPKRFLPRHLLPLLLNSLHEVRVHIRPEERNK